jgi:hypothetical protein
MTAYEEIYQEIPLVKKKPMCWLKTARNSLLNKTLLMMTMYRGIHRELGLVTKRLI